MISQDTKSSFIPSLNNAWENALTQSKTIGWLNGLLDQCIQKLRRWSLAKSVGNFLKQISVYITMLLFVCLPLPQFTNDKQGLAVILIAAFICWFTGKLLIGRGKYKRNFVDGLVILFFCINIISTCSSHYFTASIHGLLKLFVYVLAYFLFSAQLKDNPKRQFVYVFILLIGGVFLSLDGLYQYKIGVAPLATWEDPNIENQATRIYATLNNPNLLAGYLIPLIMLSGSFVLATWNVGKWFLSIVPVALTILLTAALFLTGSRGGYIGVFAGYLALFVVGIAKLLQQKKRRAFVLPVLLLFGIAAAIFAFHYAPNFAQRITSIFAGREHSSNSFRLNVWLSSFAMFKDNWLIGVGVGNQAFRLSYGLYMLSGFDALGTYCVPLEIVVETGIFGLLVFGTIIISVLYLGHLVFWSQSDNSQLAIEKIKKNEIFNLSIFRQWLSAGAAVAIIAMLAHGLVDTVFFRPQIEFIFFLLITIVLSNTDLSASTI